MSDKKIPDREPDFTAPETEVDTSWSWWEAEDVVVLHWGDGEDAVARSAIVQEVLGNPHDSQYQYLINYLADKELLDL